MTAELIEPWRALAEQIIGGDPALAGLLDLTASNPDTPVWRHAATQALAGDEEARGLLGPVAMRAAPILREMRQTAEAILSGGQLPPSRKNPRQALPLGGEVVRFTGGEQI
ncbi:MAG: hypothetical protein FJZ00_00425 [Candidatus Sericytochromatia bacterium]|uniref:Uncharacterized protein n=1 Tax=Candidatus Tanganyikabacteria bacterium TaxID=2961651 RepID=A0A937X3M8_9BACT|nr:hypothetical protein [Candidatus Tanganyikabacteria bacterium]